MIVVVDTNVWISALHFSKPGSTPYRALHRAALEDMIATSYEIELEIFRVLTEKFEWDPAEATRDIGEILLHAIEVKLLGTVKRCRDPKDDMILECALRAEADLIVAGDKDLLVLGSFEGIRIVTPAEYVQMP